jgi:hypothetical protein
MLAVVLVVSLLLLAGLASDGEEEEAPADWERSDGALELGDDVKP